MAFLSSMGIKDENFPWKYFPAAAEAPAVPKSFFSHFSFCTTCVDNTAAAGEKFLRLCTSFFYW